MTNLRPVRGKVVPGETIPPNVFIPCDCVLCRESQESEFVVTYARVLIDLMVFRRVRRERSSIRGNCKRRRSLNPALESSMSISTQDWQSLSQGRISLSPSSRRVLWRILPFW